MLTGSSLSRAVDALQQRPAAVARDRTIGRVHSQRLRFRSSCRGCSIRAEFGTYKQLFLIYATLFGVAQLGMAESLYYFIPRDSAVPVSTSAMPC